MSLTESPSPLRGFTDAAAQAERAWEARFRSLVDPGTLREFLRTQSAVPHHAGSRACHELAQSILARFTEWGLDAWIEEYEALLPQPVDQVLELVEPDWSRATLDEPPIAGDSTSGNPGQLPSFNAYSADGDVTAPLVYVNYGVPADYQRLAEQGVDVAGKIVIARYGGTAFRGLKPKTAAEHGALGCILYSDPKDDGYYDAPAYPDGPARPTTGVQRGSTYYMPVQNGDPLSPGWASEPGSKRLSLAEARATMPPIPVLPISSGDALPFLRALAGPVAPIDWRGALGITYRIGPGPAIARLKVELDWKTRPIYNVIARIEGAECPDQWIVRGNHHDAWVHGATDPGSGNITLQETARVLSQLVREGWRPRRTIVLASWDAEEWGLIGSSEWGEKHAAALTENAVAYINTDLTGRAWLTAGGSHTLQRLVSDVARVVPQPNAPTNLFAAARDHLVDLAPTAEAKRAARAATALPLYGLGAETDYAVFIGHLGIASLDLLFDGDWNWRGVYHSSYDSFDWYVRFGDPTFAYCKALTEASGIMVMRLADATVLPFGFHGLATAIREYVLEIEGARRAHAPAEPLDWTPIDAALLRLDDAADSWEPALAAVRHLSTDRLRAAATALAAVDRLVYTTERLLRHEPGLPDRPWFRHLIYASDPYRGRVVSTLPMIREGVERGCWEQARAFVPIVARALDRVAEQVEAAARSLASLSSTPIALHPRP